MVNNELTLLCFAAADKSETAEWSLETLLPVQISEGVEMPTLTDLVFAQSCLASNTYSKKEAGPSFWFVRLRQRATSTAGLSRLATPKSRGQVIEASSLRYLQRRDAASVAWASQPAHRLQVT